jgi:protein transport protein SEC13
LVQTDHENNINDC